MYKNVASQVVLFYAYNTSTETAQTGDSANITCQVSIDGGTLTNLATNTASEIGSGVYSFTTAQADNNGGALAFIASSATANVSIEPLIVFTLPSELATAVSGLTAPGTSTGLVRGQDTDSLDDIANTMEAITTADSLTWADVMTFLGALTTANITGDGTQLRNVSNTKNRIAYTVDESNNRTVTSTDAT